MHPETRLIVVVSLHFMILFTAFNAFQTIVTKIHQDQGERALGPFIFILNYGTFMIANLFVSKISCSEKWQITLSTLTYVLNYSTGFFISGTSTQIKYVVSGLGAIVNGVGGSFLWTSVGSYIHKVCHYYGRQDLKGHYYGLFNTIFCLSTVLGALVVTFGLSLLETNTYFILVSSVAFLAFLFGIFFIKEIKLNQDENKQALSNILQQKKSNFFKSACQSAISTLKCYPVMKYTLSVIILDGVNIGVVTSTMLHLMPTTDDRKQNNLNAGLCLILYGVGCVIGGYLGGKLCDRLKIKLSSKILIYAYWLSCLFSIVASQIMQMWSAMVACFLWGFVLYYITANLMVVCSRLYGGKPEAFALTKQFHCIAFVLYQVISMATNNQIPTIYIMATLFLLGIPAVWGVSKSPKQKTEKNVKQAASAQNQDLHQNKHVSKNQSLNINHSQNHQISSNKLSQKLLLKQQLVD